MNNWICVSILRGSGGSLGTGKGLEGLARVLIYWRVSLGTAKALRIENE